MSKLSRTHRNMLEVSLGWTLKELREQQDVNMRIDAQITFWRVVEGLISALERDNSAFDTHHFTEEVMRYAGLPTVQEGDPRHDNEEDWFLKRFRGEL